MRQPLVFNHAQGRAPSPMAVCLGVCLLVGIALLLNAYHELDTGNVALQRQLQARQASLQPVSRNNSRLMVDQAGAAEIAEAQTHIHTPWLPLLQDLENVHQPQVYWMQLSPDAKRKHIRMTVLATHRQQGWALVERLKTQAGFADVKLNASESTDINGLRMTTLHLEAGWKF